MMSFCPLIKSSFFTGSDSLALRLTPQALMLQLNLPPTRQSANEQLVAISHSD